MIIIKLGGSVVTRKSSSSQKIRKSNIKRLAKEISEIYKNHKIILVHGAGYGHYIAKQYNLHTANISPERKLGFCLTDHRMLQLSSSIMNELLTHQIPALFFPPHSITKQSAGKLVEFDTTQIQSALKQDLVPVLSGDVVLDDKWNCSVLSGDTIVCYLARKLKANKVIFLTDVDGVFDKNPKISKNAKLISLVNNKNVNQVLKNLTSHNNFDVSGEIKGKIEAIKAYLPKHAVVIANGLRSKYLLEVAAGSPIG